MRTLSTLILLEAFALGYLAWGFLSATNRNFQLQAVWESSRGENEALARQFNHKYRDPAFHCRFER